MQQDTRERELLQYTKPTSCELYVSDVDKIWSEWIVSTCRKLSDGLFLRECENVSKLYPNIEFKSMIIDNCCMQVGMMLTYLHKENH